MTAFKEGWHGDTSRMFKIGEVSVKADKLINTTYESMMKAIKIVKDGVHLGDIGSKFKLCRGKWIFSRSRFCGHGIGQNFKSQTYCITEKGNRRKD